MKDCVGTIGMFYELLLQRPCDHLSVFACSREEGHVQVGRCSTPEYSGRVRMMVIITNFESTFSSRFMVEETS